MSADAAAAQVRAMTMADLDSVLAIAAGLPQAPQWPRAAYEAALNADAAVRRVALVAEIDGRPVGFAVASVLGPEAELETMAVASVRQRQGVATDLWMMVAAELRRAGVGEMLLEVRASNREALGLYGRLGFKETGRRKGYYADPAEDAVLMRLGLD
ncbi:MAG TPA: ribosomal protein S18-alanine N-acetyltransferase [Terracidiphilus sp.]|nr:ribosomal protein S18-alanine N-acetyltransferase [Terracidiphilus sp.]